ncbi:MAG TPA: universal stress protein [Rhodocyclaceae bacterium]|nr:universal stress protein [Rhodocyclaceae bacterium]
MSGTPRRILLATDLSPRCDRALDRAVMLATQWGSELVVLHALERFDDDSLKGTSLPSWRRPPDPVSLARKQLLADVGTAVSKLTVLIDQGDPADAILRAVDNEQCELIIIGAARNELLGRFILGGTVDRLLHSSRVPLLVVKTRPRAPYGQIVVATDFSGSSLGALKAAVRLFPDRKLMAFHAYDHSEHGNTENSPSHHHERRAAARNDYETFIAKVAKPPAWQEPHVLIEDGPPVSLLHDLVHSKDVDLIVLGSRGRNMLVQAFLGSVAKAILNEVPCDALLVRQAQAALDARERDQCRP